MATFKNATKYNVTTVTDCYTAPADGATVIGLSVANAGTSAAITCDVQLYDASESSNQDRYLIRAAPIGVGSALAVVGGDQKVVLENGDKLKVTASAVADVIISVLEN